MSCPDYGFYREAFGGRCEEDIIMPFISAAYDILSAAAPEGENMNSEIFYGAVCAQAEYSLESEGISSVKLGDFSASYSDRTVISPRAVAILEKDGLLFRGDTEVMA